MLDHVFVEGSQNKDAYDAFHKAISKRSFNIDYDGRMVLKKGTEQAIQKNLHNRAVCDRCERAWLVTITDDGKQAEIAESEYLEVGLPRHREQRPINLLPESVHHMRSWLLGTGIKLFWMSPTACPGNNDGSCLALAPASYWERPVSRWDRRHSFADGLLRNDKNATYRFTKWVPIGWPDEKTLPDKAARRKLYTMYPNEPLRADAQMTDPAPCWRNYLAWRLVWIQYWIRGGSRSIHRRAPRMWGHVEADVQLYDMGLLSAADFEDIYCMPLKAVEAIWSQKSFQAIDRLEQFAGVRRDLDKATFGSVHGSIRRAKTAVEAWTSRPNTVTEKVMLDKLHDIQNTMMYTLRLPTEKCWPGDLPDMVPQPPKAAPSVPLMALDDDNLNAWFVEHVINDKVPEFAFLANRVCGCPRGGKFQMSDCERAYREQKKQETSSPPVVISGTEVPLPLMPAMPVMPVAGSASPDPGYFSASPSYEFAVPSQGVVLRNAQGKIIGYTSHDETRSPAVAVAEPVGDAAYGLVTAMGTQGGQGQVQRDWQGRIVSHPVYTPAEVYQCWVSQGQVYWY